MPSDQQKEPCPRPHHRRSTLFSIIWLVLSMTTCGTGTGLLATLARCPTRANGGACGTTRSVRYSRWLCVRWWPGVARSPRSASGLPTPPSRSLLRWRWVLARRAGRPSAHVAATGWRTLDTAIGRWAAVRTEPPVGKRRAVAIDGKTVRGSAGHGIDARHLLAAIDHCAGVVLGQVEVASKTNEITQFTSLCDRIGNLTEAVVTADALHTQNGHADYLVLQHGAYYVLTVKGNQPALHNQMKALPWKEIPPALNTSGRAHGRTEQRIVKVVTVSAGIVFPHSCQAIQITRKTRRLTSKK